MSQLTVDFNPVTLDIFIDQGDDFSKIITLSDQNDLPLDLTGFTFTATMKEYYNTVKAYNLQAAVFGNPINGQIRLFMTSANTQLLIKPRYVYSVRGTDGTDTVRVLDGQVLIQPIA